MLHISDPEQLRDNRDPKVLLCAECMGWPAPSCALVVGWLHSHNGSDSSWLWLFSEGGHKQQPGRMLHGRFSWSKKEEADLRQCEQAGRVHTTSESCQKLGLGSSLLSLSPSSQVYNVWVLPRASGTCLLPFRALWLRSFDLASLQMWLGLSSHPSYFCRQNESPQPQLEFWVVTPLISFPPWVSQSWFPCPSSAFVPL